MTCYTIFDPWRGWIVRHAIHCGCWSPRPIAAKRKGVGGA